jgi:hypothetical protein
MSHESFWDCIDAETIATRRVVYTDDNTDADREEREREVFSRCTEDGTDVLFVFRKAGDSIALERTVEA